MNELPDPPRAEVVADVRRSWPRLLPLLALVLVAVLLWRSWEGRGPELVIRAANGHGIAAGDELRYRNIAVGRVESVELGAALDGVVLRVRLERSAASLARAGSRFWIVRPIVGIEGARGLETLLGARYVAVAPGPEDSARQSEFVALEEPPLPELDEEDGLDIVLEAAERFGLGRGAPISYRGVPIGAVVSVNLASDSSSVELRARIRADYGKLVRADSRFFKQAGAELSLDLGGVALEVGSLQSLWLGGIALATPTHPGPRARTGQRFLLARDPEDEWLDWRPSLALGGELFTAGAGALPELVRCRSVVHPKGWFARERSQSGWTLHLAQGFVGPVDVLAPSVDDGGEAWIELGGQRVALEGEPSWTAEGLACRAIALAEDGGGVSIWPAERVRALESAEDCLVVTEPAQAPVAIAATHLEREGASWVVAPSLSFDERWHGAAVLARADGRLVGLLCVESGLGRVAPIKPR